jgi:hypothetical protein
MKSERIILIALPLVALAIGAWVLLISPKKTESAELKDEVATLQGQLEEAEAQVAAGEAARQAFSRNYGDLVSLGAAAPEDDDQATLVYDLSRMATSNDLRFDLFQLGEGAAAADAAAAAPATPAPEGEAAAEGEAADAEATDSATTASAESTTPAVATESSAAALPIGATVGSAGLPIMAYNFQLTGSFFSAADYLGQLTESVEVSRNPAKKPVVHGRLLTVDGFSLVLESLEDFPKIDANFAVTSYLVPPEQGLSAGATPAGPAPVGAAPETPAPVATTPQTATVTP